MTTRARIVLVALLLAGAGALAFFALDVGARFGLAARPEEPLELYGNVDIRQVELGFRVGGRMSTLP